jgi:hypothetical protein
VEPPRRDERRHRRALVLLEWPLGDVVLDVVPALVHRVGALAEAEVALTRARTNGDLDAPHAAAERPSAERAAQDPQLDPAPGRVIRRERHAAAGS